MIAIAISAHKTMAGFAVRLTAMHASAQMKTILYAMSFRVAIKTKSISNATVKTRIAHVCGLMPNPSPPI
jgi:hypothetical protein